MLSFAYKTQQIGKKLQETDIFYIFSMISMPYSIGNMFLCGMKVAYILQDAELGAIQVIPHPRARRCTFRSLPDGDLSLSIPPSLPATEVRRIVEQMRPRLTGLLARQRPPVLLQPGWQWTSQRLKIEIGQGHQAKLILQSKPGWIGICCPEQLDYTAGDIQEQLRLAVKQGLRHQARLYLPQRLEALARQVGVSYQSIRISSSRGRWGSCSGQRSISLSCYLMLLPDNLIDYVLLHELAHTREMNHGPRFWALLDEWTAGQAHSLRQALKGFQMPF